MPEKKSLAELRAELRALRKESVKPVSRMRKGDISSEIDRLRGAREETPAVAAVPSVPPRRAHPAAESLKAAKESEFPVAPESSGTKKGMPRKTARKAYEPEAPAAAPKAAPKMSKKDMMAFLSKLMSDDE